MKLSLLARVLALVAAIVPLIGFQPAPAAAAGVPSVTDPRYFVGVNVPWYHWGCDFGCGAKGGVSSSDTQKAVAGQFAQLKEAGIHTVRWWAFEGDALQMVTRDGSGTPTGLNPAVYADFDAALTLADKYDLAYDFVLFSGPTAVPHAWLEDPNQRQHLADALAPLFERYKNNPHILAWEFFNEPEFDVWNGKIGQQPVQDTVKLLASTVHAHTATAATVGSADLEGVLMFEGQGLDFYSPHWYDHMDGGLPCARCTDVPTIRTAYNLDNLPIVLGEFYGGPDTDTLQRFRDFRSKGYSGAWAWSLFPDQTSDKMHIDLAAAKAFSADPGPTVQSTPDPGSTAPVVQLLANWVSPTYTGPGQVVTFNQDISSSRDTTVMVDFEVYDPNGQKVAQTTLDSQPVSADGVASFSANLTLPTTLAPGQYTLKTGAFSPGGGTRYAWSDSAGMFVVSDALASSGATSDGAAAVTDAGDPGTPSAAPESSEDPAAP
jgi:hypothetical protein